MKDELVVDQYVKSRKPKSRELSSKSSHENATKSTRQTPSPQRQKPRSSNDVRNKKNMEISGFMSGLWPSTTPSKSSVDTLNDHLKHDRNLDLVGIENHETSKNSMFLSRQRSCTEFRRHENNKEGGFKENHRPSFSSSMRYAAGKLKFPGKSKSSSSKLLDINDDHVNSTKNIEPGRLSVDEDALRRSSFGRKSYNSSSIDDSESGSSDLLSGSSLASYMAPTASSRQYFIEISSKYSQELMSKSRRWSSDTISQKPSSADSSPRNFKSKNEIKKANSFSKYGSKFGVSPGRSDSPVYGEDKVKLMAFSDSKPLSSPSRGKGVGSIISIGLELFKGKKSSPNGSPYLQPGVVDDVHQLKIFHNSLIQWRYANARAQAANTSVHQQAERDLTSGLIALRQMQQSVQKKNIMLEKEKRKMKLNRIIYSQIKLLEAWGYMERQYESALSQTIDHLHSAVCRVPLVDGAKAEPHSSFGVMSNASDLGYSIKSILSSLSSMAEDTVPKLAELAEVVTQEKLMLEECLEIFKTISILEIQERSLKCTAIQGKILQHQFIT
ncbi:hypothetical protein Leryth_007084 [Lithospermum erythrorhizon]|nr:hypothetical protein Leryth_007084 [Lithospermum erythrorhizon]